jgi:hypothetical protein
MEEKSNSKKGKFFALPGTMSREFILLVLLLGTIFVFNSGMNIATGRSSVPFAWLADSFLHGHFYFLDYVNDICANEATASGCHDFADYGGKYFLPLGPMPAVVVLPFVAVFGRAFPEYILSIFINLLNLWLILGIAKRMGVKKITDRMWLAIFYLVGSVYLGMSIFGSMWHLGHVLTTAFLLGALYEFFGKRRWWLMGALVGFAGMTRFSAYGAAAFFGLYILAQKGPKLKEKIQKLALFGAPCAATLLFLFYYNFARFGGIMEGGYSYQVLDSVLDNARSFGLVSLRHVPGNIFFFLFQGFDAVRSAGQSGVLRLPYYEFNFWGLSILFTSPILLLVFLAPWKDKMVKCLWAGIIAVAIPIFTYYGIGYLQTGFRYALDFYPLLLVLLILATANKLDMKKKALILIGVAVNLFICAEWLVFILKSIKQ